MVSDQPPRPANMTKIVAINQGKSPCTLEEPEALTLPPHEAFRLVDDEVLVLDTRSHRSYSQGHIRGAYSVDLASGAFEQNAGWILPIDSEFLLVVDSAENGRLALHKLAFVGLDQRTVGLLEMRTWAGVGLPQKKLPLINVDRLNEALAANRLQILDVRESDEWRSGHIASASHMSFKHLSGALNELCYEPQQHLAVVCASGNRSTIACSILRNQGFSGVLNVVGGMRAWHQAGLPVEQELST